MDNAMTYEYLIRRAHQCGRYGVAGANADIFRSLEKSLAEYNEVMTGKPKFTNRSVEETYSEYMFRTGEISTYVTMAIDTVRKNYREKLNQEQDEELGDLEVMLFMPTMDEIVESMERAEKLMMEIGLPPK